MATLNPAFFFQNGHMLVPIDYDPFAVKLDQVLNKKFDDTPTDAQFQRDNFARWQEANEQEKIPTVLPPETLTQDQLPMREIDQHFFDQRQFNPGKFLPPSYGAGRFQILTENHPLLIAERRLNSIDEMIAMSNQRLQTNELMNQLGGMP